MRIAAYVLITLAGILLLVLPISVPIIKTSADLSMFNTNWNGCSEFAKLLAENGNIYPIFYPYSSVKLSELEGTLLIIGPNIDFSQEEAEEVKKFVEKGGIVFIADDFGSANSLLEKIGIKARFSKIPLIDIFYINRSEFPVVVRIEDPELAVGVDNIKLNIPAAIIGAEGEIFSSKVSLLGDKIGSYPIMAEMSHGKGKIILFSDPSVFMNDMFDENRKFVENLVEDLGKNFYYDEAHRADFNPYSIANVYIHKELSKEDAFKIFIAISAAAILIESGALAKIPKLLERFGKRKTFELPDWVDRKKLEKMIEEMKIGSRLGRNERR